MYKLIAILPLLAAAVSAGIISSPIAIGHAPLVAHAPIAVAHAPIAVAHAPVASSYSNQVRIVSHSVPVARTVAHPVAVAHAPVLAAPALTLSHGGLLHH